MRKIIALILAAALFVITLSACGEEKTPEGQEAQTSAASSEKTTPESTSAPEPEPAVSPYAWQGLQDMPKCRYLDLYCSYHFYLKSETYVMGLVAEQVQAVDGINSYTSSSGSESWSIDGKILSVNHNSKIYAEYDLGEQMTAEGAVNMRKAMDEGTNMIGREFVGKGTESIPEYSEHGDTAQYEYYEYTTDVENDAADYTVKERFYMKDGDVFAIYQGIKTGSTEIVTVSVVKTISPDIPKDIFELPDLTGYTKQ